MGTLASLCPASLYRLLSLRTTGSLLLYPQMFLQRSCISESCYCTGRWIQWEPSGPCGPLTRLPEADVEMLGAAPAAGSLGGGSQQAGAVLENLLPSFIAAAPAPFWGSHNLLASLITTSH